MSKTSQLVVPEELTKDDLARALENLVEQGLVSLEAVNDTVKNLSSVTHQQVEKAATVIDETPEDAFVAYIYSGREDDGDMVSATGRTAELAEIACRKEASEYAAGSPASIHRNVFGVYVPLEYSQKNAPTSLPEGYRLLVMERASHNDGHPYEWRFFAVKNDRDFHFDGADYQAGESSIRNGWLDCNSEYYFDFPTGSMEFEDGEWKSCESAHYDY